MTANAIEEAVRLAVLDPGSPEETPSWHELGRVIARTYVRTGYKGGLEVVAGGALDPGAAFFLRNCQLAGSVRRWRVTRSDGSTFEGPFALESYAPLFVPDSVPAEVQRFELSIAPAGEIVSSAEPGEEEIEARVIALGQAASEGFTKLAGTMIETRPSEVPLDDALSAVLAGGITGLVVVMLSADPDATVGDVQAVFAEALVETMNAVEAVR